MLCTALAVQAAVTADITNSVSSNADAAHVRDMWAKIQVSGEKSHRGMAKAPTATQLVHVVAGR